MGRTIDLDMALDAIATHKAALLGKAYGNTDFTSGYDLAHRHICEIISVLPSAEPEQKVGKWEAQKGGGYKCSECGRYALDEIEGNYVHVAARTPYCPFCGKKMEEQNETD